MEKDEHRHLLNGKKKFDSPTQNEIQLLDDEQSAELINSHLHGKVAVYSEPLVASLLRCFGCLCGYTCGVSCCPCCCWPYKTVQKGFEGVVQEFGRVTGHVEEGLHYVNPITAILTPVNMKIQVINLERQDVITSDNLSIKIDSVVYYQSMDVDKVLFKVDDVRSSVIQLSFTTLREVIGKRPLQKCLEERKEIADHVRIIIENRAGEWGVHISDIQIKDIIVPTNIMNLLSSAATAEREATAKIINARADVSAAELMKKAADMLNSDAAMQIRHLEVMRQLAESNNAKIIFMPTDAKVMDTMKQTMVAQEVLK